MAIHGKPGRGRIYGSIEETIGDTPLVRLPRGPAPPRGRPPRQGGPPAGA